MLPGLDERPARRRSDSDQAIDGLFEPQVSATSARGGRGRREPPTSGDSGGSSPRTSTEPPAGIEPATCRLQGRAPALMAIHRSRWRPVGVRSWQAVVAVVAVTAAVRRRDHRPGPVPPAGPRHMNDPADLQATLTE